MNLLRAMLVLLVCGLFPIQGELSPEQHFLEQVMPLLESRCISCHGQEKQKANLRLDSREAVLKGGEHGPAIVPGKPGESLLLQAVQHTRSDLAMPPKEKLSAREIAVLERWIAEGAPWPQSPEPASTANAEPTQNIGDAWSDPRNPIVKIFGGQRLDLWSYKPIIKPAIPSVRNASWPRNPIDHFVLAAMEKAGELPAPEADPRTVARRASYSLTGLPPAPAELHAFLQDPQPGAYERLVDQLLSSRAYGEHFARQWLDVIRYSDSNGFDWDEFRPRAWRFRDYVIRSFNADKSFDQFVREQLAGDELLKGPPQIPADQDSLLATGYLRLGPHDNSAPLFNEQGRSRAELMADLVETTGSALLGLTLSCCRCHDHKTDPISQADHYRFRAFFEGVKFADDLPLDLAPDQERIRQTNEAVEVDLKIPKREREAIIEGVKTRLRNERLAALTPEERALLEIPKDKRPEDLKSKIEGLERKVEPREKEVLAAFTNPEKQSYDTLSQKISDIEKRKLDFTLGLLMTDAEGTPPATKILFQGNHKQEREPVTAGFLSALDPNPASIQKPPNPKTSGRRLTLAEWIISTNNPFAARVIVNRVWQSHFGQGLVATPNDFGFSGAPPSNPDLLDWLAADFMQSGWSLKKLNRLIVTSAAYRQASSPGVGDSPTTRAIRPTLRRLSAEQLRDSLLAVSGLLREKTGGAPVWPELPPEVIQSNPALLDDNAEKTKGWYPSPEPDLSVRSVYLVQKRTVRVPFMETFDLPENSISCPRRNESTVAPQSLSLLNGSLAIRSARAMAQKIRNEAGDNHDDQIQAAFDYALQRTPYPEEKQACHDFLLKRSLPELCRSLLNANEFIYID